MEKVEVLPELKQIIGGMLFAAKEPLSLDQIRKILVRVAKERGGIAKDFGKASENDIDEALQQLKRDFDKHKTGLRIQEIDQGFRLENDTACGIWLREMLAKGKPQRLSKPALETLAIIAYRQPCTRAEIESVRGVAADQIVRNLLELQLIKVTGRSALPGRPWMFGTTRKFLERFGLKDIAALPGVDELRKIEEKKTKQETLAFPDEEEVEEEEIET